MKSPYIKLELVNDWGSYAYGIAGAGVPDEFFEIVDKLKQRKAIPVRFKDGTEKILEMVFVRELYHVNDMGHESNVETGRLFVIDWIHGHPVKIPVEDVEVILEGPADPSAAKSQKRRHHRRQRKAK